MIPFRRPKLDNDGAPFVAGIGGNGGGEGGGVYFWALIETFKP